MIFVLGNIIIFSVFVVPFTTTDVLETERSSFFGFTHEVSLSGSTLELVDSIGVAVMAQPAGDRPVRRYYQRYETPFVSDTRRQGK